MEEMEAQLGQLVRRTPARTFVVYPVVVLIYELIRRRGRLQIAWPFAPLLIWGYLQYRLCGNYRVQHGRGGPGLEVPPEELVSSGAYAIVRNPMYLGHLIFLTGLAMFARSGLGAFIAAITAYWFNQRVSGDEERLVEHFGAPYVDYLSRVPRWIPGWPTVQRTAGPMSPSREG